MERTLDVRPSLDPRNHDYPIRFTLGPTVERRPINWQAPLVRMDQGREGACVGFGWANEMMSAPQRVELGAPANTAHYIYREAQTIDEWPGEAYEGTSVLAGAKVLMKYRYMDEVRWAFSVDDVIDALCSYTTLGGGPVVLGVPWLSGMFAPRPSGLLEVNGTVEGGHCVCATGYHPGMRLAKETWTERFEVIKIRQSWGADHGKNGDVYIRPDDLQTLWDKWADGGIAIQRHKKGHLA